MKKTVHAKKIVLPLILSLVVASFTLFAFPATAKKSTILSKQICIETGYDTIVINKFTENKKYNIRLFPDAHMQVLLVSANSRQKKDYQFYMFDMDGKLITQSDIPNQQTTVLQHLLKGNYLFEIFSNDERIENGQLTVK